MQHTLSSYSFDSSECAVGRFIHLSTVVLRPILHNSTHCVVPACFWQESRDVRSPEEAILMMANKFAEVTHTAQQYLRDWVPDQNSRKCRPQSNTESVRASPQQFQITHLFETY